MAGVSRSAKTFTPKQGQYLAFIHLYTRLHRRPPAETDMQEYFRVSPPSVHQMVLTLERAGFIRRQPRTPRSIELLVDPKHLPELLCPTSQNHRVEVLGANVLVGGSQRSVALQPLSLQGQTGINIAAGIGELQLYPAR
jgi:SOS-response transcriptional repressor LexA